MDCEENFTKARTPGSIRHSFKQWLGAKQATSHHLKQGIYTSPNVSVLTKSIHISRPAESC